MPTSIFQTLQTAMSSLLGLNQKTTIPQDTDTYNSVRVLPQRKDRNDFSRTIVSGVDPTIGTAIIAGTGMTISQSTSNLNIASGTTARSETIIRSTKTWQDALNFKWSMTMSQRIANCNVYMELVDVIGDGLSYTINSATSITVTFPAQPFVATDINKSMTIGAFVGTGTFLSGANNAILASISGNTATFTVVGFAAGTGTCSVWGLNYQHVVYTGTTATNAAYGTQRSGWPLADATATINTTASPGHDAVVNVEDDMAVFLDTVAAVNNGQQYSTRATSHRTMPAGDIALYWQVRVVNLGTAPASTTTINIGYIDIENYVPQQVSVTSVRPQPVSAPMPVQVQSSVGVTATTSYSGGTGAAASSDGMASPTAQPVNEFQMQFNGSSWDRVRNNIAVIADASAAKTVSVAGGNQTNFNARGCVMTMIFGAVTGTTPTIAVQLQWSPDGGTTWLNYGPATFAAATPVAANTWTLIVYPTNLADDTVITGLAAFTTGATVFKALNAPLPRIWRFNYTVAGTTPSITFAMWVNYLN